VQRAQADGSKIEVMLAETKIRAPFSGVIIGKTAERGKVTVIGEALLKLEDQSTLKFRTRVKEQDIAHIQLGQEMTITVDALDDLRLTGSVSTLIPSGDISTHESTVEVTQNRNIRATGGSFESYTSERILSRWPSLTIRWKPERSSCGSGRGDQRSGSLLSR
jgi:multidrug efflux pump subunit AcrA (membrane-fusion protein)